MESRSTPGPEESKEERRQRRRREADRDRLQRMAVWATAAVLVTATAAGLRYARRYQKPAPPPFTGTAPVPPGADGTALRSEFVGRKENRRSWYVSAERIDFSRDRSRVTFSGNIRATLLDAPTGAVRAVISAPGAVWSKAADTLEATGQVTCRLPPKGSKPVPKDGSSLPDPPQAGSSDLHIVGERVTWSVGAKELRCPARVAATLPDGGGTAEGAGLTVDLESRAFSLRNVRARFFVQEGEEPIAPLSKLPL